MKLDSVNLISTSDRKIKDVIHESVDGNVYVSIWLNFLGVESVVRQQAKMFLWNQINETE